MKNLINYFKGEFENFSGVVLWFLFFLLVSCFISLIIIGTIIINN
jgi:hypothetical protein